MELMREPLMGAVKTHRQGCLQFIRDLVRTPSPSGSEGPLAQLLRHKMQTLGYKNTRIDKFGNVIARVGHGPLQIAIDAHLDTAEVGERAMWRFDPYEGEFKSQKIYGHGVSDCKAALGACVYAGAIIQALDLCPSATIWIIGSVQTQVCEGLAYKALFEIEKIALDAMVVAMPTSLNVVHGQRGVIGISLSMRAPRWPAYASVDEKNPIYQLAHIVQTIRDAADTLPSHAFLGKAAMWVTQFNTHASSTGWLPETAQILIQRRYLPEEQPKKILAHLKQLCGEHRAKIDIELINQPSYRRLRLPMERLFPPWQLPCEHPLVQSASDTFKYLFRKPAVLASSPQSTVASYTSGVCNIPAIGFGPGTAHTQGMNNDHVRMDEVEKSMAFYAALPALLSKESLKLAKISPT